MLQFVEGTSGSGKTDTIRHMLMEKAKTGKEKLLLLVPEQNSFENERAMLRLMGPKEAERITVTSFTRMVDLVMRQTGGLAGRRLNDSGRNILMSLALSQVKEELALYQKQSGSRELVELMLSALKEFKMCGIRPENLKAAADRLEEGNLRKKIRETGLVMAAYEALVSQSYIDPLDDLTRLKNVLEATPFFKGYTVMVDAFAGFTAQELEVLSLVLRQAKETVISVCVDQDPAKDNGMGLFSPVKKTVRQLKQIAKDYHIPLAPPIRLPHGKRFQNEELKLLEQVIYRRERLESGEVPGHIVLYNASDIYEEADFVARRIQKLVQEEGVPLPGDHGDRQGNGVLPGRSGCRPGKLWDSLFYGSAGAFGGKTPDDTGSQRLGMCSERLSVRRAFPFVKDRIDGASDGGNRRAGKLHAFVESQRQAVAGAVYHASQGIFSGNDGRGSKKAGRAKPAA